MGVVCSAPTWVLNAPVNAIENGAAHKSACDGGEHASERKAQGHAATPDAQQCLQFPDE